MYVKIPNPMRIGDLEYTLHQCVEYVVDSDPEYSQPASKIRMGQRILQAFEADPRDGCASLNDDDWAALSKSFEGHTGGFGSFTMIRRNEAGEVIAHDQAKIPGRAFLPFIEAIACATKELPAIA
jgi:hypothetical protein